MKKIRNLTKAFFVNSSREFAVPFWTIIFPTLFFVLFVGIFENIGTSENLDLKVGIYYEEPLQGVIKTTFDDVFSPSDSNDIPFQVVEYDSFEKGLQNLKNSEISAFVVFPENFNLLNLKLFIETTEVPDIKVYYTNDSASMYAKDIFEVFIDEINIMMYTRGEEVKLTVNEEIIGIKQSEPYRYRDFLFPAIILMSVLTVAVFNMPFDFSYYVEKGVFKRLNSTPIKGNEYFFSFLLSHLILLLISLIVLYIEAYLFDVSSYIYKPGFIAYSGFSILVILSVGLLLSSFYKNMGSAEAISQVIYQATIFLSGFYFEVTNTPWFIRWYVYFNPATYLVDGLRKLMTGNVLVPVNIIVPVIWMMASILIFSMSYKGMVYREK
ncbi:hypothetical protein X925_02645 [Petrotoga sp. 9T1HF07.CasAA.8.2]|uniref:ABC transporter permease n=1 Tax=Petrotoga sp. 9T1HF07.CasAA.8.2 TaxID=1434329 RepID=UPI000CBEC431|nr:ABC transporter permease [Petrotoga sp. 9T1HF07.CasAA.8.2]PNR89542.1 hypothetical protein X925_02645 [Petrotoga sp. 9T1HF07.CasAA.8.2]